MSQNNGTLIIGASQAGVQLASSLRELGYTDPVTIVGAEPHPPYQRPPLSKAYLQGTATAETLSFRTPDYYEKQDIQVVVNERIVAIDKEADGSGVATSKSGRKFPFTQLALTTGARPRRLESEGSELDGILYLRSADDAEDMKNRLSTAQHVVVVGGGFIGLEAAASSQKLGKEVAVLEAAPRLRSEEHTSELQSRGHLVCRLLLEKKKTRASGDERHGS